MNNRQKSTCYPFGILSSDPHRKASPVLVLLRQSLNKLTMVKLTPIARHFYSPLLRKKI
ncbi:hypothetical protein [Bathymodiolus thermophilus thioautotrophic gill symbiont]|uniref:hypothetical protein n=1 Tax=Bathymodiolus thermophilus thioautotrophic gill symbiont TaxID=2360 RepID=UPI001ED91247|nr:hypothetical protein [Bathymodiolus thermophilus thioautotrophic gill symbiont]